MQLDINDRRLLKTYEEIRGLKKEIDILTNKISRRDYDIHVLKSQLYIANLPGKRYEST